MNETSKPKTPARKTDASKAKTDLSKSKTESTETKTDSSKSKADSSKTNPNINNIEIHSSKTKTVPSSSNDARPSRKETNLNVDNREQSKEKLSANSHSVEKQLEGNAKARVSNASKASRTAPRIADDSTSVQPRQSAEVLKARDEDEAEVEDGNIAAVPRRAARTYQPPAETAG